LALVPSQDVGLAYAEGTSRPWLRLALLVVGLLLLDLAIGHLTWELWQRTRPAGQYLLMIHFGWNRVPALVLAVWLTWGPGRLVARLVAVLLLAFIYCGINIHLHSGRLGDDIVATLVGATVFLLAQILTLHALAYPVKALLQRQGAQRWRWSLADVIACTAFAAISFATIRLHDMYRTSTPGSYPNWLDLVTQTAPAAISLPLVGWAIWNKQASVLGRILLVTLAFAFSLCVEQGLLLALSGRWRLAAMSVSSAAIVASALVHFGAMRTTGIVWRQGRTRRDT
jgi:hypothetical protein